MIYPNPNFENQVSEAVLPPLEVGVSGEITASRIGLHVGTIRRAGKVKRVFMSVGSDGSDTSNSLGVSGEVYINGTSCLTTQPVIHHVSGEAAVHKTTVENSSSTGIQEAVIDEDNNSCNPGDTLTSDFTITRTATPDSEIENPSIVIEFAKS